MNVIFCLTDDITTILTNGYTLIRVYSDTSEDGDFTTLEGTISLVADTESYTYTDVGGTTSDWYKTCYYGATPGESDKSAARKSDTSAAYATVEEFRLHSGLTRETDDVEIAQLLDAGARGINRFCNRPDGFQAVQTAATRYYAGQGKPYIFIDECVAITTVSVKDSASDTTYTAWTTPTTSFAGDGDWIPFTGDPRFPQFNRLPFTGVMVDPNGDYSSFTTGKYTSRGGFRPMVSVSRGLPTVNILARWGHSDTIPSDVKVANLMQALRWSKRLHGGMATSVAAAEMGTIQLFSELDPDVKQFLVNGRYVRPVIG